MGIVKFDKFKMFHEYDKLSSHGNSFMKTPVLNKLYQIDLKLKQFERRTSAEFDGFPLQLLTNLPKTNFVKSKQSIPQKFTTHIQEYINDIQITVQEVCNYL